MDLIASWILFPAVLLFLCCGCGLALEWAGRVRIATALLPVCGLAVVIVVGQFLTLADTTAELTMPAVTALALLGLLVGLPRRGIGPAGWAIGAAAAVFALYAAPIVLSGEATIAGFIKLDDTATWLALTDRVLEHGRNLDGLAPSTYEATLHFNLADGYPIGVFLPLGVAAALTGIDVAWVIQPYMATLAAMLALGLWALARALAPAPALRAAAATVGAVPALLFGYYLWGGVKEVAAAALIAALAALVCRLRDEPAPWGSLLAPAFVCAGLIGILSGGGGVWLVPLLVPGAVWLWRRLGAGAAAVRAAGFAAGVALLSLPVILPGGFLPPTSSPLTDAGAIGNLAGSLEPAQIAGIWPAGDFRFDPDAELLTYLLIAAACMAAAGGLIWAARRREPGPALYVLGVLAGVAILVAVSSPWVEGKGLATASAAVPFAAMLGAAALVLGGHRWAGAILIAAVAGGVLWSAALAYREVSLAPRAQLEELREIGEIVAGAGPTLMTEYSPYGARHFLRDGDPESISELRRHPVPLRDGSTVPKGQAADTDEINPVALGGYAQLVVRRGPAQSRPPAQFELGWAGEEYELWTRRPGAMASAARLPLGDAQDPTAIAICADVAELIERAGEDGTLIAAERQPPILVALGAGEGVATGEISAEVEVAQGGEYGLWLGGSIRPLVEARIDGRTIGSARHILNNEGGYVNFGSVKLTPGSHQVEIEFGGADLAPGSSGSAGTVGPLVLAAADAADARLVSVAASAARSRLCGRRWDWIEVGAG